MTMTTDREMTLDYRLHTGDAEDVAQWLYASGHRDAAATVRNQLDVRNSRIRELQEALDAYLSRAAEPVAWRYRVRGKEWELFHQPPCLSGWGPNEEMEPLYIHPSADARKCVDPLCGLPDSDAEAVARDAARYRWLRTYHPIVNSEPFIARHSGGNFSHWTGKEIDQAIDAAMSETPGDE